MKIYIIDNTRKLKKIKNELEKEYDIEERDNINFKMTKNDYVILSDETKNIENLEKLKNIIILVEEKSYKYIWKLATEYKTIDIIDNEQDEKYIVERIKTTIKN